MTENTKADSRLGGEEPPAEQERSEAGGGLGRRLTSMLRGGGTVVERLTDSLKEAAGGGLLQQALDARDRGNLAAAFHLLEEANRDAPEEDEVASAFWDAAVAYDRPEAAAEAAAGLIRRQASSGSGELAAQFWTELSPLLPDALAAPGALARLIPVLQERIAKAIPEDEEEAEEAEALRATLLHALRAIVDERNEGLNPGIAAHVAELAREIDTESALRAARIALAFDDLHDGKRRRLVELVLELDPSAAEELGPLEPEVPDPPTPEPTPDPPRPPAPRVDPARSHPLYTVGPKHEALSESEIEAMRAKLERIREVTDLSETDPLPAEEPAGAEPASVPALQVPDAAVASETNAPVPKAGLEIVQARLEGQDASAISLSAEGGPTAVRFDGIEALAVVEIGGADGAEVQIDLIESRQPDGPEGRRVVRIVTPSLDDPTSDSNGGSTESYRDWLPEVLSRSRAVPLPDPESALGLCLQRFSSVEDYEEQVLRSYRTSLQN